MPPLWLLALLPAALAQEPAALPPRHWEAVMAANGLSVSLVGMSVVFVGLTVLFLTMTLLRALLDRPAGGARPAPASAAVEDTPEPLDPRVAAAIAVALQLELRRRTCAASARGDEARQGSGWIAARGGQWVVQQQAFTRSRR